MKSLALITLSLLVTNLYAQSSPNTGGIGYGGLVGIGIPGTTMSPEESAAYMERQLITTYLKQAGTSCKMQESQKIKATELKDPACKSNEIIQIGLVECTFSGSAFIPNVSFRAVCREGQTAIDCARDTKIGTYYTSMKSSPTTPTSAQGIQ